MKNRPLLFTLSTLLISILMYSENYGQVLQITSPNITFAACPGEWIQYTVNNNANPLPTCYYTWTVTNGEIEFGSQSGNTSTISGYNVQLVRIRWFEVDKTQTGTVTIKAESCDNANGNDQISKPIPILSLKGVNPSAITGDNQVNVNVTTNKVYEIDPIAYPNIGSSDNNPKEVSGYEWQIPSGWTVVSGGNSKKITVKPDNCSVGSIRVRGKNTSCDNTYYSNWSPVKTITRTLPNPGAITSSTGLTSVNCSDVTPVTYSIPAVTGATSYTWTAIPSQWSGMSATNSITLTPNGLNGGTITVVANGCSLQSQPSSINISINLTDPGNPPIISGATPVCTIGSTFMLSNMPPNSTVSWTQSSNLTMVSGQGTNNYTVRANSTTTSGSGWVEAIITTPCGIVPTIRYNVWVGKPYLSSLTVDGEGVPISCDLGFYETFTGGDHVLTATFFGGSTNPSFLLNSFGSPYVHGSPNGSNFNFNVNSKHINEFEFTITSSLSNACGSTTTCTYFTNWATFTSPYPNPSNDELNLQLEAAGEPKQVSIFNSNQDKVFESGTTEKELVINTASMPDGYYIVKIMRGGKISTHRLQIKH